MNKDFDLKKYLLMNFRDKKYPRYSLMEIYYINRKYFEVLKKKNCINEASIMFFDSQERQLNALDNVLNHAIRKLQYIQLIDEYVLKELLKSRKERRFIIYNSFNKKKCKRCKTKLIRQSVKLKQCKSSLEYCPECGIYYISFSQYRKLKNNIPNGEVLNLDDVEKFKEASRLKSKERKKEKKRIRLAYKEEQERLIKKEEEKLEYEKKLKRFQAKLTVPEEIENGSLCYLMDNNKFNICPVCKKHLLENKLIIAGSQKKVFQTAYCRECNVYCMDYKEYKLCPQQWEILNKNDISKIQSKLKNDENLNQRKLKQSGSNMSELSGSKKGYMSQSKRKEENTEWKAPIIISKPRKNIATKDFIVRRSIFKCTCAEHKLKDIDAIINLIDQEGQVVQETFAAGYCEECKAFFIMNSTYQYLKEIGTPVCRIINDESYKNSKNIYNYYDLRDESILMEYGYSVSQKEGLSEKRRRKILTILIDDEILTRNEIINYLESFISLRQYEAKYKLAISKWKSDRNFISQYKVGEYNGYGVSRIYVK